MPFSTVETIRRMQRTTFCVAPTGDSDGFTQRFYYIVAAGCIPVQKMVECAETPVFLFYEVFLFY